MSEQTRANRVNGARKAAATRKRMAAFMATGVPIEEAPERGTERGDYTPSEILARIRAAGPRPSPGNGTGEA